MIDEYFSYARERHAIYLRRAAGAPPPWTEDPVLQQYRFCNIFRELDKTTQWFRTNVREPLRGTPEVLLATVVFRLFNRITTGEAIFCQREFITNETLFDMFQTTRLPASEIMKIWRGPIKMYCGGGPYTTGSYMTKTPTGMDKLTGMLQVIQWFVGGKHKDGETHMPWRVIAELAIKRNKEADVTLESVWNWLTGFPFIGDFTAYEIVTDLRHTALLDRAPDIRLWASAGPGAKRGLRLMFDDDRSRLKQMQELLNISLDPRFWPGKWPPWEMREVEHTLCEFFKYERARSTGQGTRQRFRGGVA